MKENNSRNYGLDLVRAIAIILVPLVHSFGNSNYNQTPMNGMGMFFLLMVRCIAFCCVPFFIMLTGYCNSEKKVSKTYFKKIKNILLIYFIVSIITMFYKIFYLKDNSSIYNLIIGIFNCQTIPYAWYIRMYIGLFFMSPYLNILYHNINSRQNKKIFIIILIGICSFPQTLQAFSIANHSIDIMPAYWNQLYPILYYMCGCYIKEYKINIDKYVNLFYIIIIVFIQSFCIYFYCQGNSLNDKFIIDYNFFPLVLLSILTFIFLYNINCNCKIINKIVLLISKYSFGMYLFCYIYDTLIFKLIRLNYSPTINCFLGIIVCTPIILICTYISSLIINKLILATRCILRRA